MLYWCTWKINPPENDDGSSGGSYPIPLDPTTEELVSLSATINFIGCWMQALEKNLERCNIFFCYENMFQKIPVKLPKPPSPKEKHLLLLHAIGGGWNLNKLSEKLPPETKSKLRKKLKEKDD